MQKKEYFEDMIKEIKAHEDFGKRNSTDIGIECGYLEEDVLEMVQWLETLEGERAASDENLEGELDRKGVVNEDELSEISIMNILQIKPGEKKVFSDNVVHISAYINCDGELEFQNCVIYYNETSASDEITLGEEASLIFKNCNVICKGYDEHVFISGNGKKIIFERCCFKDCSQFLKVSDVKEAFEMKDCYVLNCYGGFVDIGLYHTAIKGEISGCVIKEDGISEFNEKNNAELAWLHYFNITGECGPSGVWRIENNRILGSINNGEGNDRELAIFGVQIGSGGAVIENCSFQSIDKCMEGYISVEQCFFKDCRRVINTREKVVNSYFEDCTDVIVDVWGSSEYMVSNCQFLNCYDIIISGRNAITVAFCEFVNTRYRGKIKDYFGRFIKGEGCIVLERGTGMYDQKNRIYKCIFNGVDVNDGFLIMASGKEKPRGTVVSIEECDFVNCTTKRSSGKIIKQVMQYTSLVGTEKNFDAISIYNCKGLDKVNQEGSEAPEEQIISIKEKGKQILASMEK